MRILALGLASLLSLFLGTASYAQTETPVADPRDFVEAMIAAVEARDPDSIAGLYAEDAIVLSSGRPVVAGRPAIRDLWVQNFAGGYARLETASPRTERGADRALMIFVWRATIQPNGQDAQQINGRSMVYFTLEEGEWLISADMWQPVP
ncbi:MAG: hypothetical protein ACI86S_001819 [Paracoccaceae bacterium]|jgi:uncharacterized protein (TIGR02246 family)